jgi:hypothetical protein
MAPAAIAKSLNASKQSVKSLLMFVIPAKRSASRNPERGFPITLKGCFAEAFGNDIFLDVLKMNAPLEAFWMFIPGRGGSLTF